MDVTVKPLDHAVIVGVGTDRGVFTPAEARTMADRLRRTGKLHGLFFGPYDVSPDLIEGSVAALRAAASAAAKYEEPKLNFAYWKPSRGGLAAGRNRRKKKE